MKKKKRISYDDAKSIQELKEFKDFLGPVGAGYSEVQLRQLQEDMRVMADILLDFFLSQKKRKQRHIRF